jgi:GAF domain-containing protein
LTEPTQPHPDGMCPTGVFPPAVCELLCSGLPQAKSLDEAMGLLEHARSMMLGRGLLTVNLDVTSQQDPPGGILLMRIWTSQPAAYPVGGSKRKTRTPWTLHLLEQCRVFVGEGDGVLAEVFDDHARIASLNLHAVVNVPIVHEGRCLATFNVLGQQPHWQERDIAAIRLLALLSAPHVMTAAPGFAAGLCPPLAESTAMSRR